MLIKHMAACLVATALVAAPALAQSPTANSSDRPAASDNRTGTLGSPAMNAPGTTAPSATSGTMGNTGGTAASGTAAPMGTTTAQSSPPPAGGAAPPPAGGMIQSLQQGQFLASDLIGTRVVGQNNEAIGDVNDVVMGRDGKAMAVVVGVGGFLGIGEKDVAIPFEQAQVSFDAGQPQGGSGGQPASTGSTGGAGTSGSTTGTTGAQQSAASNEPQRIVINMTKEQLQQAPAFRTSGSSDNAGSSGTTGSSGGANTNPPPRQ